MSNMWAVGCASNAGSSIPTIECQCEAAGPGIVAHVTGAEGMMMGASAVTTDAKPEKTFAQRFARVPAPGRGVPVVHMPMMMHSVWETSTWPLPYRWCATCCGCCNPLCPCCACCGIPVRPLAPLFRSDSPLFFAQFYRNLPCFSADPGSVLTGLRPVREVLWSLMVRSTSA